MQKKIIFLLIIGLFSSFLYAGPFGLEKGMSLEQVKIACGGRSPVYLEDDIYIINPIKPHPDFVRYVAWIDSTEGLYYIKAMGKDIETNGYGIEIRGLFNSLKQTLEKNYGDCEMLDILIPDSYWDDADDWMYSLSKKERYYYASWTENTSSKIPEELNGIYMAVMAESAYSGYIVLEYEFKNSLIVKEKKEIAESDIL